MRKCVMLLLVLAVFFCVCGESKASDFRIHTTFVVPTNGAFLGAGYGNFNTFAVPVPAADPCALNSFNGSGGYGSGFGIAPFAFTTRFGPHRGFFGGRGVAHVHH